MVKRTPRTGKLGETLFDDLCSLGGVTAHRVGDDQNGWDFIVEFPAIESGGPADERLPAVAALVQIKSSLEDKKSYRVKLSNALNFAQNAIPCFVLKVVFDKNTRKQRKFYLQHFWKPQIDLTLERVRRAHVFDSKPLNQIHATIPLGPETAVEAKDILDEIEKAVRAEKRYSASKSDYSETVGYEAGNATGSITLAPEHLPTLIDAMLGLKSVVPIEKFVIERTRFGIGDRNPNTGRNGVLKVDSRPFKLGRMVISPVDSSEQITLPAELFASGIPNLPVALQKGRIRADFISMTLVRSGSESFIDCDFSGSFDPSMPITLDRVHNIASVYSWMAGGQLDVQVWIEDRRVFGGTVRPDPVTNGGSWKQLERVARALREFVTPLQWPEKMTFKFGDFADLPQLARFAGILAGTDLTMSFSADQYAAIPSSLKYLAPICAEVGAFTFFGIARCDITGIEKLGSRFEGNARNFEILRRAILRGSMRDNQEFIDAESKRIFSEHEASEVYFPVGSTPKIPL